MKTVKESQKLGKENGQSRALNQGPGVGWAPGSDGGVGLGEEGWSSCRKRRNL